MSDDGETPERRGWSSAALWSICFAAALLFHGAGVAALLARWNEESDLTANPPVVMIDLAPAPVAPTTTPTDVPPDPIESKQQIDPDPQPEKPVEETKVEPEPQPEEKPPEKVDVKPDNSPKPELSVMPPPKPVEKPKEKKEKPKHKMASVAHAPSAAEQRAERAASPSAGANSNNPNAVPNWKSQLVAQLERNKRYPSEAQARGDQGVVRLSFSIDRSGGVHNARIVGSSGSSALDQATLSLVARAAPLPPPPPEVPGAQIPIVVPIRYNMR
jgi:periplasmic protein TonB